MEPQQPITSAPCVKTPWLLGLTVAKTLFPSQCLAPCLLPSTGVPRAELPQQFYSTISSCSPSPHKHGSGALVRVRLWVLILLQAEMRSCPLPRNAAHDSSQCCPQYQHPSPQPRPAPPRAVQCCAEILSKLSCDVRTLDWSRGEWSRG